MTDKNEISRVEGWFRQRASGIRNAFKILALGRTIKPEILTPPMKDLAFTELLTQSRRSIADAFGIPQTMLDDAANYATAHEHRISFWSDTIRPRAPLFESVINRELLKPMGLELSFKFDRMEIFQHDEVRSASALQALVNAGYPLGLASEVVGVDLPDDWDYEMLDKLQQEKQEKAQAQFEPKEDEGNEPEKEDDEDTTKSDLDKWQRKAIKRIDKGQPPACTFESEHIPAVLAAAIIGQLEEAQTKEDVRRIFETDQPSTSIDLAAELKRANDLLEKLND